MTDQPGERKDDARDLDAREAARIRRRDRDADAAARDLMRPGMGKVFKQIQDAQARAAKGPVKRRRRARGKTGEPQSHRDTEATFRLSRVFAG